MPTHLDYSTLKKPKRLVPIIRHLSYRVSPILAKIGLTPNQVTLIGLAAGILSAITFSRPEHFAGLYAAALWGVCCLMDYCDGEVARLTGTSSKFGKYLDDFVDWAVHTAFFVGLGVGAAEVFNNGIWFWFGIAAGLGTTVNSLFSLLRERARKKRGEEEPYQSGEPNEPSTPGEFVIYVFRGLFRADFWLLVLILQIFGVTWILLLAAAIGTHVFWMTGFIKGADRFVP